MILQSAATSMTNILNVLILKSMAAFLCWAYAKPVIIGHGISHATAFKNMIRIAVLMIETKLSEKIRESFAVPA